jgi:hypothetical protein
MTIMLIWRRSLVRLDRNAIYQICLYFLAVNLVCNTWVLEHFLGAERMEQLSIRTVIWSFHSFSLVSIGILLRRRNRPITLKIGPTILCVLLFLGTAEALVQFALFSKRIEIPALEYPSLYADPFSEDAFWVLSTYAAGSRYPLVPGQVDPILGWPLVKLGEPEEGGADSIQEIENRPLLFFGDSFAIDLPAMMEPALPQLTGLNYAVPGYATDQIFLRVEQVVPQFKDRQPLVLIGILLQDMDRSLQTFRACQKPYFTLEEGVLQGPHFPRYQTNREFVDAFRFGWRPFLLRGIQGVVRLAFHRNRGTPKARRNLNAELLRRITNFLRREQVRFLFVLFCNSYELEEFQHGSTPARLKEINAMLAELDVSVFRTMDLFVPATQDVSLQSLYRTDGHHSQAANQRIAQSLVQFVKTELETQKNRFAPDCRWPIGRAKGRSRSVMIRTQLLPGPTR